MLRSSIAVVPQGLGTGWTKDPFVCNDFHVDYRRSFRRRVFVAVAVVLLLDACGTSLKSEPRENVRPPAAGTPGQPSDVQGIYRSVRNGVLQLRGNGDLVLIVGDGTGASSGKFTLQRGRLDVQTSACGDAIGSYDLAVTGEQEAGKAALRFTGVSDSCADRLRQLTIDPWIYANS